MCLRNKCCSDEQQAIASRAAKETSKLANGSNAVAKPTTGTSSKKLLETGSKVKRGVMGFLRELKDELRSERPTD